MAFGGQDSKRKEGLGVIDKDGLGGQNFASLSKLIPEPEDDSDLGEDSTGIEGKRLCSNTSLKMYLLPEFNGGRLEKAR